jgi:hypothetical protein
VALWLRCLGCLDLLALLAVAFPTPVIADMHEKLAGGPFPTEPIGMYLVRTCSALYALHGAIVVYLSFDVERYWKLIRFMALAALVHGAVIVMIDISVDLPLWWQALEGPCFAATGASVLALQRRAERRASQDAH